MKYYVCDIYVYCCHVFLYTQLDETVSLAGLEKAINYFEVFTYVCVCVCLSVCLSMHWCVLWLLSLSYDCFCFTGPP